ncbi:MAG: PA14 domain-containing protein, partial [Chitinophagaceae bacterium]
MKLLLLTLFSTLLIGITSVQSEQGLNYKYYEGTWNLLPDFNSLTPVKSGVVTIANLDQRRREKQFAFLYQGYITIPTAGNYTFETLSDDGSKLYIGTYDYNAISLVNNDGLHNDQIRAGTITLSAGVYPITLSFFQNDGNQSWEFYWSSNTGIARQNIPSSVLSTTTTTTTTSTPFAVPTGTAGLNYSYYEGAWSNLPDFNSLPPVKTGSTTNVDLSPRNRDQHYAFVWQGYINIPITGTYSFQTISDDGSKVYVGSTTTPVVNNDGLHGSLSSNANVTLTAGLNPIVISYFNNEGDQQMELYWASTSAGISRQKVPDNVLSTSGNGSTPPPSSGAINYNYYEGTWSNLPDFSSLTPVKSGTTSNISLSPRNRDKQYAFVWQGSINIPTAGNYSFETSSDDGSKVYIGSTEVVNNDGLHGYKSSYGTIALSAGLNPITITFFQNDGDQYMELYWASNTGISRQRVPDNVLSATTSVVTPVEPAPPVQAPPVVVNPPSNPGTGGSGGLTGVNNYYFSSTNGDDSRTAEQAKNASTPWRTISKLNSVMSGMQAGDAALFNRGDVFDGSINFSTSGITLSAYGNGNKPVVNGFSTLSNWTSIGNGVWQASCPSGDRVNMVAMNGAPQAMGRYPNITEPKRGYNIFEAHNGTFQITDYQLSGSINWTGAEVVIRKNNWVLDRCLITNHSGNNINYVTPTAHVPLDNYGYFIQNSPQTLDQLGEWYFDPAQRVLKMYFGSNNPNSYEVKASTVNTLVSISGKSNIIIDNLSFVGGDDYGLKLEYSQNIRVQNCSVDLSGTQAVSSLNVSSFNFESNSITNTNNDALDCYGTSNSTIRNNTIKNTGMLVGMGQSGNQQYNGILLEGPGNTIELNSVVNTGYSGITFAG